jgi:Uma2 family endonuclease
MTEEDGMGYRLPLKFPVELRVPKRFDPDDLSTWPHVEGRLEWVGGRLLFMPPCGGTQSTTTMNLAGLIRSWTREHPAFIGGTADSGIALGDDRRGADVAVWRKKERGPLKGFARVPPLLAVEVEGEDEAEQARALRKKTRWYLKHGTKIVWLVLPSRREVIVITSRGEDRHRPGETIPEHPELPGLRIPVDEVFFGL